MNKELMLKIIEVFDENDLYYYYKLSDVDEIRLVMIKLGKWMDLISCELICYLLDVDDIIEYLILLYVWYVV